LVDDAYERARNIILQHREAVVRIAEALLEREILDGAEVKALIEGAAVPTVDRAGGDGAGQTQEVIKPESGLRVPPLVEGDSPSPA
jgi:cell division protease FtsH